LSHRKPTKTKFNDLWRDDAECSFIVAVEPEMETAWDNIDVGTWKKTETVPDENADVAKNICFVCPVREFCLRDALKDNEAEGLRGGYRFEFGTVSKNDARKIYNEWGLRAKVTKKARSVAEGDVVDGESEDMSGVSPSE